jgi:hypothetical protein
MRGFFLSEIITPLTPGKEKKVVDATKPSAVL